MGYIIYECEVTEFDTLPPKNNDQNTFAMNKEALVISMCASKKGEVITQTEISREDAVELAKLILNIYENQGH
jgi:hypothetical protein